MLNAAPQSSDGFSNMNGLLDLGNGLARVETLWTDLQDNHAPSASIEEG